MSVTPPPSERRPSSRRWGIAAVATLLVAAIVVVVVLIASGGSTSGSTGGSGGTPGTPPALHPGRVGPESMVTSASEIINNPSATIAQLRALGVTREHVPMYWDHLAPDSSSPRVPTLNLADPSSYPAAAWAPYDAIVRGLKAAGVGIDLALVPPPPRWAEGRGAPQPAVHTAWRPDTALFGPFVRAVATRYSGHYVPPGSTTPLPRVSFWSIWNEPDLGINLAPEAIDHSQVEVAPQYYRGLVDAAWSAFHATGHGGDTILFGELAPAGIRTGAGVGNFNSMPPLRFLRALYCVDSGYAPLRGQAAAVRGCPTTAAASAGFAAAHPGLFHASGIAVHPYPQGLAPDRVTPNEPDYAELGGMPLFERAIDRMQRAYGSATRFPIWSTEFGYQTRPPDPEPGTVPAQTAALYLNWAEYITWSDPRLRSYDQYLLYDPPNGDFATGLLSPAGVPKPGYIAFRMPLFLPVTSARRGEALDVWGDVRPAPDAARATHHRQSVTIQFRASSAGAWRTVRTVALTDRYGYFEVRQAFSGSGQVRLAWTPPGAPAIESRTVDITLR